MTLREEQGWALRSQPQRNLESPFLEEELFVRESEWEAHLPALEAESPFLQAFEESQRPEVEPAVYEEEFDEEA